MLVKISTQTGWGKERVMIAAVIEADSHDEAWVKFRKAFQWRWPRFKGYATQSWGEFDRDMRADWRIHHSGKGSGWQCADSATLDEAIAKARRLWPENQPDGVHEILKAHSPHLIPLTA